MTSANAMRSSAIAILLLVAGCSHRVPQATVEVIDTSASITPRAERAALDAVEYQIAHMERGDRLVLIPITGDAQNDAGGHVLRLAAPTAREPYDADLRRFQAESQKQFAAWAASLDLHQSRTDILGALDVARQELALLPQDTRRSLVVVSDFLEDDGRYRFANDPSLANAVRARALSSRLRATHGFSLAGTLVCLGRFQSLDYAALSPERRDGIDAFWRKYLEDRGHAPDIQIDGAGMLAGAKTSCFLTSDSGQEKSEVAQ